MATIQLDSDELADAIRPAVQAAVTKTLHDLQKKDEIKMLSRQDIMKIFHVSESKASLIKRQLPKVEGVGFHDVPEHWLRKWIDQNIKWVEGNTGYFGDFEKLSELEVI